jgi:hypothetical protein
MGYLLLGDDRTCKKTDLKLSNEHMIFRVYYYKKLAVICRPGKIPFLSSGDVDKKLQPKKDLCGPQFQNIIYHCRQQSKLKHTLTHI